MRLIAVLMVLAIPTLAAWKSANLVVDIPWGDQLTLLRDTNVLEGVSLGSLFRFHNEHLIVPTKLVIASDYWLSGGTNTLPAVFAFLFTIGIIAIEVAMLRRAHPEVTGIRLALASSLLAAILLNGRMTWTLTCPILLQHVSANFFVVTALAACACLAGGSLSRRWAKFAVCLVAAAIAAISSASGVFALPAAGIAFLTVVLASPRIHNRTWRAPVLVVLLGGTAIIAAYAVAHSVFGSSQGAEAPSITRAIRFAIYFPGGAWFRDGTWPIVHHADPLILHAVVLGFWLLVGVAAWHLWRRRSQAGEFEVFHIATITFVAMTAAVGGLFRGGISEMEALNNKYVPTALLAWAALFSLLLPAAMERLADRPRAMGAITTCSCVLACALILPGDMVEYRAWSSQSMDLRHAADAYMNGARNDHLLRRFFPDPDVARDLLSQLQLSNGYFFRHRVPRSAGDLRSSDGPLGKRIARRPDHRDFGLELINDVEGPLGKPPPLLRSDSATVLVGWAVDREMARCASRVVALVGERQFPASYGLPRPDVAAYLSDSSFTNSGFQVIFPPGSLAPGRQEIRLRIVLANGLDYLESVGYPVKVE